MSAPVVFENGRYNGRRLREWVPDVVAALVEGVRPLQIILFGSLAEGTEGPDSDIDLLVVLAKVDDQREAMRSLRRATVELPVPLDLIPTDPEEIAARSQLVGTVLRPALRHGRVIYER